MKKEFIKEAHRLQQLAGLITENYVDLAPINNPLAEEVEEDFNDDTATDDWNKPDEFDNDEFGKEPTGKDLKTGDDVTGSLASKELKLAKLIQQKDEILGKFKTGALTIDQYKAEIGNIPQQIKALQAEIEQELAAGEEEDETV